ncbi:MAG: hypothetical protein ACFFDN_33250 [Candidatus Hodarchaeota archaeon]
MKISDLPIPPEPTSVREALQNEKDKNLLTYGIKQEFRILKILWNFDKWAEILKRNGYDWEDLLNAVKRSSFYFKNWIYGRDRWEYAIKNLIYILIKDNERNQILTVGEKIEIIGGPFKGEKGIVVNLKPVNRKILIKLSDTSKPINIRIPMDYVKSIE